MSRLISIGVPAAKGRFLRQALECWKNQTYQRFEVFVQDDCSSDDLETIFKSVCGSDARFHYERNKKSTAPNFVDNWNKTLERAQGEYFVLASDDDLYEPDFLAEMVRLAEKYPGVNAFDAYHDFVNASGISRLSQRGAEYETQVEWVYALVCHRRGIVAQSMMVRTQALRDIGGFVNLPAAWGACDWLTWCKLSQNGVVNSSKVLMHWRSDCGNTTSAHDAYWLRQKEKAVELARPLWIKFAEELTPHSDVERYMVSAIRLRIIDQYFLWLGIWTYYGFPLWKFALKVIKESIHGRVAIWRVFVELGFRVF